MMADYKKMFWTKYINSDEVGRLELMAQLPVSSDKAIQRIMVSYFDVLIEFMKEQSGGGEEQKGNEVFEYHCPYCKEVITLNSLEKWVCGNPKQKGEGK